MLRTNFQFNKNTPFESDLRQVSFVNSSEIMNYRPAISPVVLPSQARGFDIAIYSLYDFPNTKIWTFRRSQACNLSIILICLLVMITPIITTTLKYLAAVG